MKATLKFDLSELDDREEHKLIMSANDMHSALFEISHNLKKKCEYKITEKMDKYDVLDLVFQEVSDEIINNQLEGVIT